LVYGCSGYIKLKLSYETRLFQDILMGSRKILISMGIKYESQKMPCKNHGIYVELMYEGVGIKKRL